MGTSCAYDPKMDLIENYMIGEPIEVYIRTL